MSQSFHPTMNVNSMHGSMTGVPNTSLSIPPPHSGHESFAVSHGPPLGHHIDNTHTQASIPPISKNVPPMSMPISTANRAPVAHSNASGSIRKSNSHISPPFSPHAPNPSHFKTGMFIYIIIMPLYLLISL